MANVVETTNETRRPVSGDAPDLRAASLFLDFDGTLVDIAERPDGIVVPAGLKGLLSTLSRRTDRRTIIITGRSLADLDARLDDWAGPVIGSHGAEFRLPGLAETHPLAGSDVVEEAIRQTEAFAADHPGLLAERKPVGVVLHFRQAPAKEDCARDFLAALAADSDEFELHPSKMAIELRPAGVSKRDAIRKVMDRSPYRGSSPIFFGDDATDEPALGWVADQPGGLSVKVGPGASAASGRLPDPEAVRAILSRWAEASP